jgi:O-antigen/teichoic acid export membrane protein
MILKKYKIFFLNSFVSALPGFFSVSLSLLSIPIYLKYGGTKEYGDYIFLHFLSFVAIILNLGLGKISTIIISQEKNNDEMAWHLIKKTIKNCFFILLIFIFLIIFQNEILPKVSKNVLFLALIGIILTNIFLTIEGIFQGKKLFIVLMLINLFFYGASLSLPTFLLVFKYTSYQNIFLISLIIKVIVIFFCIIYLFKNKELKFFFKTNLTLLNLKTQKWFSISNLLSFFYDLIDKYLINIYLGPVALATYSIQQHATGKLSIISKGISAVLLPTIAFEKKNKLKNSTFAISLKIFIFVVPLLIFILFNFFNIFFEFWLGKNSSSEIVNLAKIFSIIAWVSGLSHLIISYYEGSGSIKKNSIIEISFFPFFFIFLYFLIMNKDLIIISYFILLKEIVLFFLRSIKIIKKITVIKYSYPIIIIACFFLYYSINIVLIK